MVQAAGVEDAAKLIRDYAAAGLVKTYAELQVRIAADGARTSVRRGAVPAELWDRMVDEGADGDAWTGGTVRLVGSELIGGMPAVHVTGLSFNPAHVQRLVDQQLPTSLAAARVQKAALSPTSSEETADPQPTTARYAGPDASAIPANAILCTVKQAGEALGFGRTKVNELMKTGLLERRRVGSSTRITLESGRALAVRK